MDPFGIYPWIGRFDGSVHQCDSGIADEEITYILSAKIVARTIRDLLADPDKIEAIRATKAEKKCHEEHLKGVRTFRAGPSASPSAERRPLSRFTKGEKSVTRFGRGR